MVTMVTEAYLPVSATFLVSFPAALDTVHSYTAPSVPVIIGNSKTALLETIPFPCLLHSNILLGPPSAEQVIFSVELMVVIMLTGEMSTLPSGDTTSKNYLSLQVNTYVYTYTHAHIHT